MHRTPAALAVLLAVATGVAPHAHATSAVTVTSGGRVLHAGSVVAHGRPSGGRCVFDGAGTVTLRSAVMGTAGVALRANGACDLVVTAVGTALGVTQVSAPGTYEYAPRVDESAGGNVSGSATLVSALAGTLATAAKTTTTYLVRLSQTVYDESGLRQYEDVSDASYLADNRTGNLSGMQLDGGYCQGSASDEAVNRVAAISTTEIRDCFYKTTMDSPSHVAFVSGGYFRQKYLTYVRDERMLTEHFDAYSNGSYDRTCDPGDLPMYWSNYCFVNIV
jgi:hypothetical protein